jgi:hypothetical protein
MKQWSLPLKILLFGSSLLAFGSCKSPQNQSMVEVFDSNQHSFGLIEGCQSSNPRLRINIKHHELEFSVQISRSDDVESSNSWVADDGQSLYSFKSNADQGFNCYDTAATRAFLESLRPVLANIIHGCHELSESFQCRHSAVKNLASMQVELEQLRGEIVKKARRLPYLVARRFGILGQLIRTEDEKTRCHLVTNSDLDELPLSLQKHHRQFCANSNTDFLISAAIAELRYMSRIIAEKTHWGYITLRLPDFGAKDLQLTLENKPSAGDQEASKPLLSSKSLPSEQANCFYPLHSEDQIKQLASIAYLDFAEGCSLKSKEDPYILSKNQFERVMSLIASETQFTVTNGRTKMIRLPQGNYSYAIQANGEALSEGKLNWEGRQPRIQINQF